jgi:hypothetical protein
MSTMKRALFSILVVLGGCGGSTAEDKPATKATAKPEVKAKAGAETKGVAEVEAVPEAKAVVETKVAAGPAAAGPAPELFEGEDGLLGYRTAAGEVVIPAKHSLATPFVDQVAAVDGSVFIDRTGKTLATAFMFDNAADEFVEGRARIVEGEKYGFIASSGEIVVPPTWSFVEPFSGGYAAVCEGCKREESGEHFFMTGGKWGYVDLTGKLVIPPRFSKAGPFVDGRASVTEEGRELVIGPDGVEKK